MRTVSSSRRMRTKCTPSCSATSNSANGAPLDAASHTRKHAHARLTWAEDRQQGHFGRQFRDEHGRAGMPDWLLTLLDPLPASTAALFFSLFFVAVAWIGVIFVRPFFRLFLRRQPHINEIVSYASSGFSLFYGLLLGLLSVAAYSNARDISG